MVTAKILLIEVNRSESPTFASGLINKGHQVNCVRNGTAALTLIKKDVPHLVIINAASMRTSGVRICQTLHLEQPKLPIVLVVSENSELLNNVDAEVVLILPFTLQKLLNRIRPLLPAKKNQILQVGMLQLDSELRIVHIHDKTVRLTPRLIYLLKVLMDRPGEVVERKELYKTVWDTSYTDDMRTLDVHISWLRQALEDDPRHPVMVKTIRGVGYRLDIESEDSRHPRQQRPLRKPQGNA